MSIKPIVNNPDGLLNRSLNVTAHSIKCSKLETDSFQTDFLTVLDNAEINSLNVTTNTITDNLTVLDNAVINSLNVTTNTITDNLTVDDTLIGNVISASTSIGCPEVNTVNLLTTNINGSPYVQSLPESIIPSFTPVWSFFNFGPGASPVQVTTQPTVGTNVGGVISFSGSGTISVPAGTNSTFFVSTILPVSIQSTLNNTGGITLVGSDTPNDFYVVGNGFVTTNQIGIRFCNTVGTLYDGQKTIDYSWTGHYSLS
jgi:hypothetical protein